MTLEQPELPPSEIESRPLLTVGSERRRGKWLWIAAAVAVAVVVLLAARHSGRTAAATARAKAAPRPIPVTALPVKTGDVPVYIDGLGTVTALNTVTIHTRVDGQLIEVAFREGQIVHAGDLLARIDPRPFEVQLTQAEGQRAKDEAALENARLDLKRYEALAAQDAVPRQQLDTQVATVHQDEAAVKSDQGQVDSAKLNLTYSRVTAPITGRVGLRLVDTGNIVHASDAGGIVVLTQLQPIAVVFTIPADQLPNVAAQMRAGRKLAVDAVDRDMKRKIATGTLVAVDNQIDTTTGTVRLKAEFPNTDNALFANQFVNARLLINTLRNATVVPAAAVQRSAQSTFVWLVGPDSAVRMVDVGVAWTEGDRSAVSGPIAPGQSVVVDGVDKLQTGTKVAVAAPPGPGATGAPGGQRPAPAAAGQGS